MKNIFKDIKNTVKKALYRKESRVKETKPEPIPEENFSLNTGPVNPGLEEKKEENVGKKVFEKTGQLREGVGQSSTLNPQEKPVKTNQGIKHHSKNYKKHTHKGTQRGPKDSLKK